MTHIYIPSHKRHLDVRTLSWMSDEWLSKTTLVVHESEVQNYEFHVKSRYPSIRIVRHSLLGIENIRSFIGLQAKVDHRSYFFMIDDDFKLYRRSGSDTVGLVKQTKTDFDRMMSEWSSLHRDLKIPVTGISARSGNNHFGPCQTNSYDTDTRINGAVGYDTNLFLSVPEQGLRFMEDFGVILWCLTQGHRNAKLMYYAYDQAMTNAPGGCSGQRTHALQSASAHRLAELFPDYVKVVQKENKTGGEFGVRTDVKIFWQKAARAGRAQYPDRS